MDLTPWAVYLLTAAAATGAAMAFYRRREPAGRGRHGLAALRGLAVATVVLLLLNPTVPAATRAPAPVVALLDASLSMAMPTTAGGTAWEAADAALRSLAPDRRVRVGSGAGGSETGPEALESRLAPAIRAALESDAGRVVVFTDGAVEDPAAVHRLAEQSGRLELRRVGGERASNGGLVAVSGPVWARVGEPLTVRADVAVVGAGGPDSGLVVLRRGGREVARAAVALPAEGGRVTASLTFVPRAGSTAPVRLDAALESGGGSMADDDHRSLYVRIAEEPAGAVVVSLLPDHEARFLYPVLGRALGVPVAGWLRVTDGRWARLGSGLDAGRVDGPEAPERAVRDAELVVVHGLPAGAPAWVREAVGTARRLLVFPSEGGAGLPVEPGPETAGDWYVSPTLPSSPLAPLLAGAEPDRVPPLSALRTAEVPAGWWAPATARLGRRDRAWPILVAGELEGRRVAVALGAGYWRWSFAGPEGRAFYGRFWSAVAGWLGEEDGARGPEAVRPVDRVVARGTPVRWHVPADADSARIRLWPLGAGGGAPASAAVVDRRAVARDGMVALQGVGPGHYRYTVEPTAAGGGTARGARGDGELTVSAFSPEFTRRVGPGWEEPTAGGALAVRDREARTRPLRDTPWGYVVLVTLLAVEWVLRRRWGLR